MGNDQDPFRYRKTLPEIIYLRMLIYVRFSLSLGNVLKKQSGTAMPTGKEQKFSELVVLFGKYRG